MPIKFDCPECGRSVRAPDHIGGKKTKCPGCTQVIVVPKNANEGFEIVEENFDNNQPPSEQLAADRRPCPICGELIAARAVKCRFCGADLDGESQRKEIAKLRRKLDSQMNGLGGLWIFLGTIALIMVGVTSCVEPPPGLQRPTVLYFLAGIVALAWLVAGIGTCMKQRWAVYIGLSLSYLNAVGSVISLVNGAKAANPAPPGFNAGMVIGVLILAVGILQGHRVNSLAKRINELDDK